MPPTMVPPKKTTLAPHRAGVMHFDAAGNPLNPRTMTAPAPAELVNEDEAMVIQATHATRVYGDEPLETGEGEAPGETDDYTPEERTKLEELSTSEGGVEKAYIHSQRKIGELGGAKAALETQLTDVLAANTIKSEAASVVPVPDMAALKKELADIGKNFLDDIPGNLEKLTDITTRIAQASVASTVKKTADAAHMDVGRSLIAEFPGLVVNKADAAWVDAYVEALPGGPTDANYRKGLDAYAKQRGWTKPTTGATPNADVDAMKNAAAAQAPTAAPVKTKGKTWRRSELEQLQIQYPQKYKDLQPEIQRAYREGRVR